MGDAVVGVVDQPADRGNTVLAEREFACCRGFQAHLVLEAGDVHPVTITELAGLGIEQVSGHNTG
jgi:hypothetical protein